MSNMIKLARERKYPYIVNYISDSGYKKAWEWAGSKNGQVDIKEIPEEVVEYLRMNTSTFDDGELKIIEDSEEAKEIVSNLGEGYENNVHSRDEIIKLLQGNFNKMKSEISKITDKQELVFICDIAKEIDLDSSIKLAYLAEVLKMPQDILFAKDSE